MRLFALAAVFVAAFATTVAAQGSGAIEGLVLRSARQSPAVAAAAGAEIRLAGANTDRVDSSFTSRFPPVRSDDNGTFALRGLDAGVYRLNVRLVGYISSVVEVTVPANGAVQARVVLEPVTQELERVITTARRTYVSQLLERRSFTERQRIGWGHFVGPDQLARSGSTSLLSHIKPWLRGCMIMYLDGAPAAIPQSLQTTDVAGVEIYSRNLQAPAAYQSARGDCGSILIWLAPGGYTGGS
jgi:hypothetical protein